ncbi:hypothetical protein FJT64_002261 [Amphibalanus amphitrite]|uniref:Uncharacterized protein n=1 Tax=Amphibalanus amphitrite TaxID=1232801 RepID=A0A6A4WJ35_AMPAM|nr:hypothetical protein FJT64_002261 [Amphibalanus amphitrite]
MVQYKIWPAKLMAKPSDPEEMYARIQFALGPTNIELTPGQPFDLQLNISVPPLDHVPPTDFKIEVFGHAITGTVYTRFALFEPRLQMDDDSQSVANFTTHLNRSTEFPNIVSSAADRVPPSSPTSSSTMTSGSSYPISVAVTFGDGLFGWSQQAMYICSQADVTFDFNGVLAPSAGGTSGQMERRGADRIDVQLQYTNAFDELRLEPRSAGEDDKITLGFGVVTDGELGDTFTITVRVLLRGALKMTQSLTLTLIESTTATLGTKYQMAQPCGVSDGDRSEAVSPTLMPTDVSVFDGNSSMVFWLGPTFYAGVSQRPNATTSRAFQMEGNITSTLPRTESTSTTLYAGGVVAFNMTVFVPPGGSYPDFRAMAARRETGLGQLRLCRASVVAVGANLPCNRYNFADCHQPSDPSHSHPEPDTGAVQLGSVCAVPTELLHGARDNLLVANFVYQHLAKFGPNNTFEDSNLPNPIYFNAIVESDAVAGGFAAQIGYATSTSRAKLAAVPASQPRKIWVSVRGAGPYRLGQTVLVDLNFKWNPGVISDAWWTITASEGDDQVKFCDIRVTHIGDNYACKQEAKQLPLIHKQSYDSPESDYGERTPFNSSRATSMVAHLMRYANAGEADGGL